MHFVQKKFLLEDSKKITVNLFFYYQKLFTRGSDFKCMKQIVSLLFIRLVRARRALALFQHHDGVTGTGKDHVVKDYGQKLAVLERFLFWASYELYTKN